MTYFYITVYKRSIPNLLQKAVYRLSLYTCTCTVGARNLYSTYIIIADGDNDMSNDIERGVGDEIETAAAAVWRRRCGRRRRR